MKHGRRPEGASLGRADWRFLLPSPPAGRYRHLVLLGGPAGLDARLQELGTAERVETTLSAERSTDALVLLTGSDLPLRAASRSLAPDAVVYWEIDRRHWSSVMRRSRWIERQLREAGLREIAVYWVIPEFRDARRYLPLSQPQAVDWFIATRFVASSPARVALESLVSVAGRRSHRAIRSAAPCLAVVAGSAARAHTPPVALADTSLPATLRDPGTNLVLLTSGQDDGSRLVALPFRDAEPAPELVIKLARLPGFTGHSEREQATLTHLHGVLPPDLQQSLPRPLGTLARDGGRIFLESVVPGRMLAASVGRWRAPLPRQVEDLRMAAAWLSDFHRATLVRRLDWERAAIDRWVEQPLAEYQHAFGVRPHEGRLFDAVRRRAMSLTGQQLPIVWTHNDFSPWHVYRSDAQVSVIDWEFVGEDVSERQGPAICDLVYFITHWLHLARGLRGESAQLGGFADLFLAPSGRDMLCDAARSTLMEYARRIGMDPGFVPMLIVHTWVDRAVDRHRRRLALQSSLFDPRSDNRFARYVETLAGRTDELFAASEPVP